MRGGAAAPDTPDTEQQRLTRRQRLCILTEQKLHTSPHSPSVPRMNRLRVGLLAGVHEAVAHGRLAYLVCCIALASKGVFHQGGWGSTWQNRGKAITAGCHATCAPRQWDGAEVASGMDTANVESVPSCMGSFLPRPRPSV